MDPPVTHLNVSKFFPAPIALLEGFTAPSFTHWILTLPSPLPPGKSENAECHWECTKNCVPGDGGYGEHCGGKKDQFGLQEWIFPLINV